MESFVGGLLNPGSLDPLLPGGPRPPVVAGLEGVSWSAHKKKNERVFVGLYVSVFKPHNRRERGYALMGARASYVVRGWCSAGWGQGQGSGGDCRSR